jgi:eight-cysteine-cluster-containing protein
MSRLVACLAFLLLTACNAHQESARVASAEPVATVLAAPVVAEATAPSTVSGGAQEAADPTTVTPVASAATGGTPAELYAQCHDRMEKPEADDECKSDGDCAIAGCSREVCTSKSAAATVFTTCERKPCFRAVTTCGCNEGHCTWALADKMPEGTWHRIDLPDPYTPR